MRFKEQKADRILYVAQRQSGCPPKAPAMQAPNSERPSTNGTTEANHIEIPKITPLSSQHESPDSLAQGLEGKIVDEFGNILGDDGTVQGRVEGDLPSMIGQCIQHNGNVLTTDGEICGYVSENLIRPPPMQEAGYGLKLDAEGNIYDMDGAVVGKIRAPTRNGTEGSKGVNESNQDSNKKRKASESLPSTGHAGIPQSGPAAPSPDEIYLDVKSTHDGIQLIIKIPTVFNKEGKERKITIQ